MNCPIRTDPLPDEGHNQNPSDMAPEINTNNTLNHRRNSTSGARNSSIHLGDGSHDSIQTSPPIDEDDDRKRDGMSTGVVERKTSGLNHRVNSGEPARRSPALRAFMTVRRKVVKYGKFIGPGFMVSVSYIDPGKTLTGDEM